MSKSRETQIRKNVGRVGVVLALCMAGTVTAQAAKWSSFKRQCIGNGVTKYSAVLHGIPFGQSWEKACARKGAVIKGQRFTRPSRCVNTGGAMWGEFRVRDEACARTPPRARLRWGSFQKTCIRQGVARYSSVLHGIAPGASWERACAAMPAVVKGRRFSRPTRCVNKRSAMWGEFEMRDRSCDLKWGSFKDNGCVITDRKGWGMRSYSAVLWNIPAGQSWERTCARKGAVVAGRRFSHPTACVKADLKDAAKIVKVVSKKISRLAKASKHPKIYIAAKTTAVIAKIVRKVNPALNMWGVFYVEDRRCPNFFKGR